MNFDMSIANPIRLGMEDEKLENDFYAIMNAAIDKFGYDKVNRREIYEFFLTNGIDLAQVPKYLYAMLPREYQY